MHACMTGSRHQNRKVISRRLLTGSLFANDVLCSFVSSQAEEDRLTKLVVRSPFREFNLGNQYRLDPLTAFHYRRGDALARPPRSFLWQVDKGALWATRIHRSGLRQISPKRSLRLHSRSPRSSAFVLEAAVTADEAVVADIPGGLGVLAKAVLQPSLALPKSNHGLSTKV